jgi:hypothetical protein
MGAEFTVAAAPGTVEPGYQMAAPRFSAGLNESENGYCYPPAIG